jgi:putative restriction endonuclease
MTSWPDGLRQSPEDLPDEERFRLQAMLHLAAIQLRTGGPVRFNDVSNFTFDGQRVALMDRQRGIRKPRVLDAALSFRTVHAPRPDLRPYDDAPGDDGYLRYKWRGTDAILRTSPFDEL